MDIESGNNIGKILRQRRVMATLRLNDVAQAAGISPTHLGRVERGERLPSGHILRKLAEPLGFKEDELLRLGGYLSAQPSVSIGSSVDGRVDPYVSMVLSQEPVEIQRAVVTILSVLKSIAKTVK